MKLAEHAQCWLRIGIGERVRGGESVPEELSIRLQHERFYSHE